MKDKEKQDRFDCKHLECCMDGCYCKAGHGSIRGYGHCVIPFEQETCKYFKRKPKTKTVKITENEVVISKEEHKKLKILKEGHITCEDLLEFVKQARKETAGKILFDLSQVLSNKGTTKVELQYFVKSWAKQFDVEIGELK